MWSKSNEINLTVKVEGEGILSRIARIKAKTEELECEVNGLMQCVKADQAPASENTEA